MTITSLLLTVSCLPDKGLRASASVNPVIPLVGYDPTDWSVWPTGGGWLIGGTGYVDGWCPPVGVTPELGAHAILFPSRRVGSWTYFPGVIEISPIDPSFPVWYGTEEKKPAQDKDQSKGEDKQGKEQRPGEDDGPEAASDAVAAPSPSPSASPKPPKPPKPEILAISWTKMGETVLPRPVVETWPGSPLHFSPWGPVDLGPWEPPKDRPVFEIGFPIAGGVALPVVTGKTFLQEIAGTVRAVLFDYLTRTIHPISSIPVQFVPRSASYKDGLYLITSPDNRVALAEEVTESFDRLPEITGNREYRMTHRAEFIFFTHDLPDGRRQVYVFDRRTRMVDTLSRLNAGRDVFDSGPTRYGRLLGVTIQREGHTDIAVYDTVTGLLDPLPGVNTPANERFPDLDDSGRWLAYVTDAPGRQEVRIYDRLLGGIDPLPDVNTFAPILDVDLKADSYILWFVHNEGGHSRVKAYVRPTGIIDPLPEVNPANADVEF
jgi:hypothetical protein